MSVLLPEPLEPTSAVVVPAGATKADVLQDQHARVVLEADPLERDLAVHVRQRIAAAVLLVFGGHLQDLANAVQARERFGDLRADRRDLDDRRHHQAGEQDVGEEIAERHPPSRIERPPMTIISTPMMPTTTVENAVIAETDVIDCAMLRNSRCTPRVKTSSSRFSAV